MKQGQVTVIIPTHDRCRMLSDCIRSVAAQAYPLERIEVLVFDDASSPPEAEVNRRTIAEFSDAGFRRLELFRSEENVKMLRGRQTLSEHADPESEFLLTLDDDGALENDTLPALIDALRTHPAAGAAGPRIVSNDPARSLQCGAFFLDPWTGAYRMKDADAPLTCDWLNTTCFLVRADIFRDVAGFDVSFHQSHAEADLCLRIKGVGAQILFVPGVRAVHKAPPGTFRPERLYHLYRNKFWVIRRHFKGLRKWTALGLHAGPGTLKHMSESSHWRTILASTWDGLFGELRSH